MPLSRSRLIVAAVVMAATAAMTLQSSAAHAATKTVIDPAGDADRDYVPDITKFTVNNGSAAMILTLRFSNPEIEPGTSSTPTTLIMKWGTGSCSLRVPGSSSGIGGEGLHIFCGEMFPASSDCASVQSIRPFVVKIPRRCVPADVPDALRFQARSQRTGPIPNPDGNFECVCKDTTAWSPKIARG